MFDREVIGDVVQLRMCHGKANALDLGFCEASFEADELVERACSRFEPKRWTPKSHACGVRTRFARR